MKVAVHQPNFMPRKAFFDKAAACDVFVLLGRCQFEKGGYQNRFHIGEEWFTMSVERGKTSIREKIYKAPEEDWRNIKLRLPQYPVLGEFDDCITHSLWITNVGIIWTIAQKLSLTTSMVEDFKTALTGTERLVEICQRFEADTYLAGVSGASYMDMSLFEKAGIKVEFQDKAKIDTRPIVEVLK